MDLENEWEDDTRPDVPSILLRPPDEAVEIVDDFLRFTVDLDSTEELPGMRTYRR